MNFDPATAEFARDFQHEGMALVGVSVERGQPIPIVAYTNEWKGRKNFHIRALWYDDSRECWCPGKGVKVPAEAAGGLCANLGKLVAANPAAAAPKVTRKIKA